MKEILTFADYYIPGYKAGGPIVTISNMVKSLPLFKFKIITRNHDLNEIPYQNVISDNWNNVGNSFVYYNSKENLFSSKLINLINQTTFDGYYFNSFFSINYTLRFLLYRKFHKIPQKKVIIAPRGEFFSGALGIKSLQKRIYFNFFRLLGLHENITWHASSDEELKTIQKRFGKNSKIMIAQDLLDTSICIDETRKPIEKEPGTLKIIFISRIARIKNLDFAIKLVSRLSGKITFDIYGPIEDAEYWNECKNLIRSIPNHIEINYKGVINKNEKDLPFSDYHIFLFPSRSENFGRVIIESLIHGCPVIISDQTPWSSISEFNAGWIIPLSEEDKYINKLNELIRMDNIQYQKFIRSAFDCANFALKNQKHVNDNIELILNALNNNYEIG
jgi:glycosyltransferase involved in cell wall biosynthesis